MTEEAVEVYYEQEVDDDIVVEKVDSEAEDYDAHPAQYEISTYPADYTLEVLHGMWKAGDIKIPGLQRRYVWKQKQASRLIESFLIGLPVPPVYLYVERDTNRLLVIDGQQRLKSVFFFFEGVFGENGQDRVFRLTGLNEESPFLGKKYSELDESIQRKLRFMTLRSFVVRQLNPNDDNSIFHIFERLNTGGTLLTNQEIRNCVYHGDFNRLLHELNANADWRRILGKTQADTRQRDIELALRFFSLVDRSKYKKPLKDYLSSFMSANRKRTEEQAQDMRVLFEKTCAAVAENLGDKPFHRTYSLNAALFDSVMSAFANNLDSIPADVGARFTALKNDAGFRALMQEGTTDPEKLGQRFDMAATSLFG